MEREVNGIIKNIRPIITLLKLPSSKTYPYNTVLEDRRLTMADNVLV